MARVATVPERTRRWRPHAQWHSGQFTGRIDEPRSRPAYALELSLYPSPPSAATPSQSSGFVTIGPCGSTSIR